MQNVGSSMASVGKKMSLFVTAPLVAAGVASFKMAEDFETSMSRVIGLAGKSEKQVDRWGKQLLILGPKLGQSPRELAEALYFVASSGVSVSKTMDVVTASAKASSAGLGETAEVADALTSVMNAYGESNISASQAADVLVATVREGKGEASDFAPVIGNVTAFASKLGVSFEEVGAALASMTQLGTDAATSSTQLSAIFSQLVKETPKGAKALKEVGLSYEGLRKELKEKGLLATLGTLDKAFGGNVTAMADVFGNIRALRGVFGLLDADGNRVAGIFKRMGESSGSLATAFEASTKRSGFTMEKFRASIEAAGIAIGTILAPIVARVATFLTQLSTAFSNLDPKTQQLIIAIGAAAVVMGPLLIVVGSLVSAIGALAPVLLLVASPLGIVVVALGALALAIAAAVLWPDKLQAALQRMGLSTRDSKNAVEALRNAFTAIKAVVDAVWPAMVAIIRPALEVIKGLLMIVSGILRGDFSQAWEGIKKVVSNELKFVVAVVTAFPRIILTAAIALGKAILSGIGEGLRNLGPWVREKLQALPGALAAVAAQVPGWAMQIGEAIVRGIVAGMTGLFTAVKDKIIGGVKGAIDAAMGVFGHSPQEIIGVALVDGIVKGWNKSSAGLSGKMIDKVNEAIDKAQAAIISRQGAFGSAFDGLVSAALSAFDKISSEFETRTEAKIRKQDEAMAKRDREQAKRDAQGALASAQAAFGATSPQEGEDPAAFAQRLLEAGAAITAAQNQLREAQFAIDRAADEKQAERERKQYDAKRERQRLHLENQLGKLKQNYLNQEMSTEQFHNNLIGIFKKFEVPLGKATEKLGAALSQGLRDAMNEAAAAARALAQAIMDQLSNIRVVVQVDIRGKQPEGKATGGPVKRGSPYVVGETGPELFIPGTSGRIVPGATSGGQMLGGGGIVVNVYNAGSVLSERELVSTVREGLLNLGLYNPGVLGGRA